ncbi:orange carotenoid protein N-terminal domain-containing protein [Phormidesmis priestleyi]
MTIDTKELNSLAISFKQLPVDDQIAAMVYLYQEIGGSLFSSDMASKKVEEVVKQVTEMREGSQIEFLQDVLSDSDEVVLDINPSKAMAQLIPGDGVESPIAEYENLNPNERLAVWYNLASKMGDGVATLPNDYSLSSEAQELLTSLKSYETEEKLQFLSQIV